MTDREFIHGMLAELRICRDKGRVSDAELVAMVHRVRGFLEETAHPSMRVEHNREALNVAAAHRLALAVDADSATVAALRHVVELTGGWPPNEGTSGNVVRNDSGVGTRHPPSACPQGRIGCPRCSS